MAASNSVIVLGAGLAGCAAALSARAQGAAVTVYDPARAARHRVCGEFLSPEVRSSLEQLGAWSEAEACRPALMHSMRVYFGRRVCTDRLPEPAIGLSRLRLDHLLRDAAATRGARFVAERSQPSPGCVLATGRQTGVAPGDRLFGFKAHFSGPPGDAVELYFGDRFYIGVNPVEDGFTNVCGLAPESLLRTIHFSYDALLALNPALAERTRPLIRAMNWLSTGPLVYGRRRQPRGVYPAGDAFSFIDPFTGAGMLNALETGRMAGWAAATGQTPEAYGSAVMGRLRRPLLVAQVLRTAIAMGAATHLAPWIPGRWLFALTRPSA
ncbi:MAG: NAD(P)/FAD-dependent oxidoreductase [Acidobacteriota bacterium]|jgi:flavin-dependent dehydrogenase